jgi:hypothetical protein
MLIVRLAGLIVVRDAEEWLLPFCQTFSKS